MSKDNPRIVFFAGGREIKTRVGSLSNAFLIQLYYHPFVSRVNQPRGSVLLSEDVREAIQKLCRKRGLV